jgi:hypothetical protein
VSDPQLSCSTSFMSVTSTPARGLKSKALVMVIN